MKIQIEKSRLGENLYSFMRRAGYAPLRDSYVRRLRGTDYPRFHIYVDELPNTYLLKLHLDQKRPSYDRQTAHSGEYEGEIVEAEGRRMEKLLG